MGRWFVHKMVNRPRFNPFKLRFYAKYYEVIPIVCICTFVLSAMTAVITHRYFNTDIVVTRNSKTQNELIDLLLQPRNRKMVTINQKFDPNPDLHKLYEDMNKAECEREYGKK